MKFKSDIEIQAGVNASGSTGDSGQILSSTGSGVAWIDQSAVTSASDFVFFNVKNETGSTILKGKGVMAVGTDGNSGHILIDEMIADGTVESKYFLGLLEEDIPNGGFARVISFGQLSQFNTNGQNGETWADGQVLWCDPANPGDFTTAEPDGPNVKIAAAFILNKATNGKIQVRVQANEGIHDLHDTKITSQAGGDVLRWNPATGVWENDDSLTTINNTAVFTDSDASLSGLVTGTLSVDSGVILNGGISSIGNIGDRYSIGTDDSGSLFISNNSIPYSAFVVNNDYIRFINGASGIPLTLTESSIGGLDMSINTVSGYFVSDEGGPAYPDNNGYVKLSSTSSEFRTHLSGTASNSSKIKIDQNPTSGSAEIQHEGINNSATFTIRTNETLNLRSGNEIRIEAGSFSPIYLGQSTYFSSSFNYIAGWVRVSGGIEATDDIIAFYSSDKRLKDNIEQIPNAIDKIQSIGGYSFDWNDKQDTYEVGGRDIGVVAQEIEEVLPELVTTRDNGYKAVKYEKIVALLIEGIKEQQEQINELKTKLDGITN